MSSLHLERQAKPGIAVNPLVGVGDPPSPREWIFMLAGACISSAIVAAGVSEALPEGLSAKWHAIISVLVSTFLVSLGFYAFRVRRMVERTKDLGATPLAYRRALLSDICRRVIGSMIEQSDLNHSIMMLLKEVGQCMPVSRAYLVRYRDHRQWMQITHQWTEDADVAPFNFVKNLDTVNIGWWNQSLIGQRPLAIQDINHAQMPAQIHGKLHQHGVKALVAAPIFIYGELEGFFAFEATKAEVQWKRDELRIITNMVDAFCHAVERRIGERQQTAAADRMEKALASAEAESRAKTDFLANMSHEIRTPMAAVVGYADMLQRPNQEPEKVQECVNHIHRNADHLLSLVNDILDLSKIEAGELTLRIEPCRLVGMVNQVMVMSRPLADEKLLDFRVEYASRVPESIQTDPVRFRQILLNLVGNAIKFTDAGSVIVRLELMHEAPQQVREYLRIAEADENHAWLRIDIQDTGIGIPEGVMNKLFSPFTQLHDTSERHFGGTGLGLDISRRLAHMLGADITVESTEGQGSVFSLHVDVGVPTDLELIDPNAPEADGAPSPSAQHRSAKLQDLRVLVVDDNVDNRRIARFFLEDAKAKVTEVGNGREAINEVVAANKRDEPYQAILMDMQMPIMDGYTATAKLREQGVVAPIIALTAYTMADDRRKCMNAGCNDYVSKPIVADILYERILEHLDTDYPPQESDASTTDFAEEDTPTSESDNMAQSVSSETEQGEAQASTSESEEGEETIVAITSQMADNPDFAPLLEAYAKRLPLLIERIETHWQQGEVEVVANTVHQLKGTGANYGYPQITEHARDCEQAIRSGKPHQQIEPLVRQLLRTLRGALLPFAIDSPDESSEMRETE